MERESLARLICESIERHAFDIGIFSWRDFGAAGGDLSHVTVEATFDAEAVADDLLAAMKEA